MTKDKVQNNSLLNDVVVKKLFTSGSKASKEYLLSIVSAVTNIPLRNLKEDFELIHPEIGINKNTINSEVDISFITKDYMFSFEINYNKYKGYTEKNFSYVCLLYLRQIKHKENYKNIKKIYSINIDNFDYFNENKLIYFSEFMEKSINKSRNIGVYLIDINLDYLSKLGYNQINEEDILERLLYIFVCEDKDILDKVYKGDKLMGEIRKEADSIVSDLDLLMYYDKEKLDKEAREYLTKEYIAKKMFKKGLNVEDIIECTELSIEEVEQIKEELDKKG